MNKLIISFFLLLPCLLKAQHNFIDVFVQPRKQTTLFFKSNVKSYAWELSVSQNVYNAIPGDRELAFFYTTGDTLPAFINVELENKEKYTFLVVYTSNASIENEYNLEDSKARGEVMLDQKERRAAGIPDLSFLQQKSTNQDKPENGTAKVEKKEESKKIAEGEDRQKSIPEEPEKKMSSVEKKGEKGRGKKKEKIVKGDEEPDRNIDMEEYVNANMKKKTKEVKEEKLTAEDKSAKKTKPIKKSNEEAANYSVAIELVNYLDLQEDGDLAEIVLIDPIELANGYKMKRNQSIKIPIEIQQGRIFITLLNQLEISYKGTIGLPLTLNKNNIDARFIKK
jgi:hypothetical protein